MLIPVNWNPNCNRNPVIFDKFITHLANYDADQKKSLLETIGVAISNINVGRRCKKSIFLQLLEQLIGSQNYAAMS